MACELTRNLGVPLSRLSISELHREVTSRGIIAQISGMTLWRWLSEDAIRPGRYRSWIFPRDPAFSEKAARVLSLYEGFWDGHPLGPNDYVISTDEKTSIQARKRKHCSQGPAPHQAMRIEHEYQRKGSWAYLAAWDVKRAKIFGRCEKRSGIASFDKLVNQVMSLEPYASAKRVFWIMDNGSSHRGERSIERLKKWPMIVPVHLPIHASWLNQIEIYFSIVQRKVLTPCDFTSLSEVQDRLLRFQERYQEVARPFEWKFTRADLDRLCSKLLCKKSQLQNSKLSKYKEYEVAQKSPYPHINLENMS
ncbi:MAG: IS630 family transposase [Bacillota bacterium]